MQQIETLIDEEENYNSLIRGRKIIYLDHNMWIYLRDQTVPMSGEAFRIAKHLVDNGQAVFPMSYPIVSEMLEISVPDTRSKQAGILDTLSLGVIIKNFYSIAEVELDSAYHWLVTNEVKPVPVHLRFTRLPNLLGVDMVDGLPELPPDQLQSYVEFLRTHPMVRSLSRYIECMDLSSHNEVHRHYKERYVKDFGGRVLELNSQAPSEKNLKWESILLEERWGVLKSLVLPGIRNRLWAAHGAVRGLELLRELTKEHGSGSAERFDWFLRNNLHSLDLMAHVVAFRVLNANRKTTPQDLWDTEHLCVGIPSGDIFGSQDRGLLQIYDFLHARGINGRAAIVRSVKDLHQQLEQLVN